jgi:hypothetical protein
MEEDEMIIFKKDEEEITELIDEIFDRSDKNR